MIWRKLLRDLKENAGSYVACMVLMIIGLLIFTAMSIATENLHSAQEKFYEEQNFADAFARVRGIPKAEVTKLSDLKGIRQANGRIMRDVQVMWPERDENVFLRLVTVDLSETQPVNGVRLLYGSDLDDDRPDIWIDNKFFAANHLKLGDQLPVIINGRIRQLNITGVGLSPEFVYALRTKNDFFPTPDTFGVAFISLEAAEKLLGSDAVINEVAFRLEQGTDYEEVKLELEPRLARFGLEALYPRAEHTSHVLLKGEIDGGEAMTQALTFEFLMVAAVIIYLMLRRMVEQQRGQIGILKALGYTVGEVVTHYLSFALIIGVVSGVIGASLGVMASFPVTALYQEFFNLPDLQSGVDLVFPVVGLGLALGFSLISGYLGAKSVLVLLPAEAMRPPAPPIGKKVPLEHITLFWNMLTVQGMMAVRNLFRNKGRSLFVLLGVVLCFSLLSLTWSMNDLVQVMLFDQYEKVETFDVKVSLRQPMAVAPAIQELYRFPGVSRVEGMAEIPVTLHNRWLKKDVLLLGLSEESRLFNIFDKDGERVLPPQGGLLLSKRLGNLLAVEAGDSLRVQSPYLAAEEGKYLPVVGIVPQYLGMNAYMELSALQDFLGRGDIATALIAKVDEEQIDALQQAYRSSEVIEDIDVQGKRLRQSKELMASSGSTIYIFALIGIVVGFAIIYNSTVITISERKHELASMMVLGMTPAEVLSVVTFEQWFLAFFAILIGMPTTKFMLVGTSVAISNDIYTMPANITATSLLLATIVTVGSIWVAQRAAASKIRRLSLVEALKSRE
ncbi:MAG TPA: ABC transporter permease [Firmicutes bacterium]|jgi:putative ABC transport system permease protein|nr:ABC transporter permease [Bacillota bacterium]